MIKSLSNYPSCSLMIQFENYIKGTFSTGYVLSRDVFVCITKTGPGYLQHLLAICQVEKGSTGDLHIERQIMITFAVLQSTKRIQPMIRFLLISLLSLPSVNSLHDCWFCIADRLFCICVC